MYDLLFYIRWFRILAVPILTFPCLSGSLGSTGLTAAGRNERGAGLLVARQSAVDHATLDANGQARLAKAKAHDAPSRTRNVVESSTQYLLHNSDGMSFNQKMPVGTLSGNTRCQGVQNCQFHAFDDAVHWCNNNMACNGILQDADESGQGCLGPGGLGCFYTATGQLEHSDEFQASGGKTYERQVLEYSRFVDGRKFSDMFQVGTRECPGAEYCQFPKLAPALAFCDLDNQCMGVLKMPASEHGEGCKEGKGCFVPAKGELQHDPLWLGQVGETYLKQQEVAYVLREGDGMIYGGRYPAGTGGCQGAHNCQFQSLPAAKAYCDANPTCKGVLQHTPKPDGNPACTSGRGCFEPCNGQLTYDAMFKVTEGKLYERHIVR